MSLKSASYYSVECDGEGCDANAQECGEFSAWAQADYALDEAISNGWLEVKDKHYCEECRAKFDCDDCGEAKTECQCEAKK